MLVQLAVDGLLYMQDFVSRSVVIFWLGLDVVKVIMMLPAILSGIEAEHEGAAFPKWDFKPS